jgi:membrane protein DedA with SNARE-associated domain
MTGLLENVRVTIEGIIGSLGYVGIALLMVAENVFPPIPSELVVPFAGFLISRGEMNFVAVVVASSVGTLVGTTFLYYLGMWLGEQRLRLILRRYGRYFFFPESSYDQALTAFNKHDKAVVFWSRLVPGLRSVISLPAGVARMPMLRFLFYTTLGTIIWNTLLAGGGVLLGNNWTQMMDFVDRFKYVVLPILAALIIFWLVRQRLASSHTKSKQKPVTNQTQQNLQTKKEITK